MNHKERRAIETEACTRRYGIADEKGAEYSQAGVNYQKGDADVLKNFKSVATRTGASPVQVLLNYFLKHVDSITTTCREAEALMLMAEDDWGVFSWESRYAAGEGIVSRLDDARNYLDLLECLLRDLGAIQGTENVPPCEAAGGEDMADCVKQAEQHLVEHFPADGSEPELERLRRLPDTAPLKQDVTPMFTPGTIIEAKDGSLWEIDKHEPTRTSVGEDDPDPDPFEDGDYLTDEELNTIIEEQIKDEEEALGNLRYATTDKYDETIIGYDGVERPRAAPVGAPIETPMFRKGFNPTPARGGELIVPMPAVFEPKDPETGEA